MGKKKKKHMQRLENSVDYHVLLRGLSATSHFNIKHGSSFIPQQVNKRLKVKAREAN